MSNHIAVTGGSGIGRRSISVVAIRRRYESMCDMASTERITRVFHFFTRTFCRIKESEWNIASISRCDDDSKDTHPKRFSSDSNGFME